MGIWILRDLTHATIRPNSPHLTANTFDALLAELSRLSASGRSITVDLRTLQFIDPFAMAGLIYACADLHDLGRDICLAIDTSSRGGCGFLTRMGFFSVLGHYVTLEDDSPLGEAGRVLHFRGKNSRIVELTEFATPDELDNILDRFRDVLCYQLLYTRTDTRNLTILLSELCNNVLDHNPSGTTGLVAMQVYSSSLYGRFTQLVVADRGVGITSTLTRNPSFAEIGSDQEAIIRCTERGVSQHAERTRGNGLYHLLNIAFRYEATVHIRSRSGKVYMRGDRRDTRLQAVPLLTGTQVSISLPAQMG